jgi:hypothetical protein
LIEFGIAPQGIKVLIALSTDSQRRLEAQGAPQSFKRGIDRPQTRSARRQTVMDVSSFGFASECALKEFLRRDILAPIQLNYTSIVK